MSCFYILALFVVGWRADSAAIALRAANEKLEERVAERTRELIQANEQLEVAKAKAERATRSQSLFLAAASHDVLQPLQAARLFIGMLAGDSSLQAVPSSRESISNADVSIEAADRLLRSLLNLSRLEFGEEKLRTYPVDIGALLRELEREFELLANEKSLVLRFVPTRLWANSDVDLLRSVLQNLVSNAIRYTRHGAILVGCRTDAKGVRIEVRDSGSGIPPEALDTIFSEFSRLPAGIEMGPGVGLGLSIAERVCKVLDHSISVTSEVGKGSTFAVALPKSAPRTRGFVERRTGALPEGLRVLFVDNDVAVLHSMEALLTSWGVSVFVASSAQDVTTMPGSWDIAIIDYTLAKEGDGLDLVEAMQGRASVFALLTANHSPDLSERAAILNVEIIHKPVAPLFLRSFLARSRRSIV